MYQFRDFRYVQEGSDLSCILIQKDAFRIALILREALGSPIPANERVEYDCNVVAAHEALGEKVFAAAWAEGRAMTLDKAVSYALDDTEA